MPISMWHIIRAQNLYQKKRGLPQGTPVDEVIPPEKDITRHSLMVLSGSFGSRSGVLTVPISTAFRAFLSRSAEVMKKEEIHVPIHTVDYILSSGIISFLKRLIKLPPFHES